VLGLIESSTFIPRQAGHLAIQPLKKASERKIMRTIFSLIQYFVFLILCTSVLLANADKPGFLGVLLGVSPEGKIGISAVIEDSPAAKAGLAAGNEVIFVNGTRIRSTAQFQELVQSVEAGQAVDLTIISEGSLRKVSVTLVEQSTLSNRTLQPTTLNNPFPAKAESDSEEAGHAYLQGVIAERVAAIYSSNKVTIPGWNTQHIDRSEMTDSLQERVRELAQLSSHDNLKCIQISSDWRSKELNTYEPRTLAVYTDNAIYVKDHFTIHRFSYSDLIDKIKFTYNNSQENEPGTMVFVDSGRTVKSKSEYIKFIRAVSEVVVKATMEWAQSEGKAANEVRQNRTMLQNALPEEDVKNIKGFGSVRWDTTLLEAANLLGVKLGVSAKTSNYSDQTKAQTIEQWAHYNRLYPGIKLSPPLATFEYEDRSGRILFHFLNDKLKVVERFVSDDIRKHSHDALNSMLTKYGAAQREVCDFTLKNGGDKAVRFIWESEFGRVIALCDAWYPDPRLQKSVTVDDKQISLNLSWIGVSAILKPNSTGQSGRYERSSTDDNGKPNGLIAKGGFIVVSIQLANRNPNQSWLFEGTAAIELIDSGTMQVISTTHPVDDQKITHNLDPYQNGADFSQTHEYLFDLPVDQIPKSPSFFRVVVKEGGSAQPVIKDFLARSPYPGRVYLEDVKSHFGSLGPMSSKVIGELVPDNMRIELRSIAYNSRDLVLDVIREEDESLKAERAESARKEEEEKAKVETKIKNDL